MLEPEIAVITNVDADHLNFYRDLEHIKDTFVSFAERVDPAGTVVISATDPGARAIRPRLDRRLVTFGMGAGDWSAERVAVEPGTQRALVRRAGEPLGELSLRVPGEHNVVNALGALVVCDLVGVAFEQAARALTMYRGVPRRFDVRGVAAGVTVVDDHAHNPAEIAAALSTAHEQRPRAVVAVFQPHLFSRTKLLARELGEALTAADRVVVTAVDGAREDPMPGVTGQLVVDALKQARPDVAVDYVPERSEVAPSVARIAREGDLVMTIGCGDVTLLVEPIIEALERR
jgi:UDP-N-acetylmuramate--alanine ligase